MKINEMYEKNFRKLKPRAKVDIYKMSQEERDEYLTDYALYHRLFSMYITEKLNLREYDKKIKDSGLSITPYGKEDMDIYQYMSSDLLQYLYMRNNMHVERLNDVEKIELREFFTENNQNIEAGELPENINNFIQKTFKKVIIEDELEDEEIYFIFFGPASMSYSSPNCSVVIGIKYNEFIKDGVDDNEWRDRNIAQRKFINQIMEEIEKKGTETLGIPTTVIKYDDFSARSMTIEQKEEYDEIGGEI